jgi:hypothetical protein
MSARIPQKRKGADAPQNRTVKTTVSLDAGTRAKLAACAALRGSSQTALAAAFIREGLRGVIAFDKSESSVPVRIEGSARGGMPVDPDDRDAA